MSGLRRFISGLVLAVIVLAAIAAVIYGTLHLTQATLGIGCICIGVFVAIIARIAQASDHHYEVRVMLERGLDQQAATSSRIKQLAEDSASRK